MERHLHSRLFGHRDDCLQEVGEVLPHFLVADGVIGTRRQEAGIHERECPGHEGSVFSQLRVEAGHVGSTPSRCVPGGAPDAEGHEVVAQNGDAGGSHVAKAFAPVVYLLIASRET
ncbi:hypothetical protein ES703_56239 [subsurface metagenome]